MQQRNLQGEMRYYQPSDSAEPEIEEDSPFRFLPIVLVALGAIGIWSYKDRIFIQSGEGRAAHVPRGDSNEISTVDHQTMIAMRDAEPVQPFMAELNGRTYAWPAGRGDFDLFRVALPCQIELTQPVDGGVMCHGDPDKYSRNGPGENYAMDIVYRDAGSSGVQDSMSGEPVWAITDGYVFDVKTDGRAENCMQMQFMSEDGHLYYYGHLSGDNIASINQQVVAGAKIGEVGTDECGGGKVAHLHIDRGVSGQRGGVADRRDPDFITDVMDPLYESLFVYTAGADK